VIYEIEDEDINNQLRVYIDGHSDESEDRLIKRFIKVKQKYIEAKGLLYRSANFGMMKNRIAHALASALHSDEIDGNKEFEKLINEINKEYRQSAINRILYIVPAIILVICSLILMHSLYESTLKNIYWEIICAIVGSSVGGAISILSGVKRFNFEEHLSWYHYILIGLERIILALLTGAVAYIGIKSGVLFSKMEQTSWLFLSVTIVAGFSETFIPGFLSKIANKA
jgi:membrane protein YqaA with SNARE-associated domain